MAAQRSYKQQHRMLGNETKTTGGAAGDMGEQKKLNW
jgi:hypothetical protein